MSEKVRKPRLIISSDEKKTIVQHREELTMAKRPVFIAKETAPFYQMTEIKFEWNREVCKGTETEEYYRTASRISEERAG